MTSRRVQTLIDDCDEVRPENCCKRVKLEEADGLASPSGAHGSPSYSFRTTAAVVESPSKKRHEYTGLPQIKVEEDSDSSTNNAMRKKGRLAKPKWKTIYESESPEELLDDIPLFFPASQSSNSASSNQSDQDTQVSPSAQKEDKGKGKALDDENSDSGSEDILPIKSPRSRWQRRQRPTALQRISSSDSIELPNQTNKNDRDLSESDLEIVSEKQILSSRTRYGSSPKKLNNFKKGLQKLKAKRDQRSPPILLDDIVEKIATSSDENSTIGEGLTYDDIASPTGSGTESINSFVVDDGDEALGIPNIEEDPLAELTRAPIQFTSHSYQDLETHFKTVIQWMVNTILCPDDFPREDEYFENAFHNLNRRVDSFRDSFASGAWTGRFFTTLKRRPKMQSTRARGGIGQHCVACNNRERHAAYVAWFQGKLYDEKTLQDYSDEESDDEDDIENEIAPEKEAFPLGRLCFERAEITHSISHWKKVQYWEVEEALRGLGCFTEEEHRKVESMDSDERLRWANGVLTILEKRGNVQVWYEMFRKLEESATEFVAHNGKRRY